MKRSEREPVTLSMNIMKSVTHKIRYWKGRRQRRKPINKVIYIYTHILVCSLRPKMGPQNGQFRVPDCVQIGPRSLLGVQEGRGDAQRPSLGPQMGPDRAAKSVPRWPLKRASTTLKRGSENAFYELGRQGNFF